MSKCDLHIHSRYSARSEEWLFRRFDFPDSYSDPKELHQQLLKCGMDYVTITDHDTIEGCLRIADLPHTFISEQVTTYFPQDQCKLSILVWGVSEQQHREIEGARDNILTSSTTSKPHKSRTRLRIPFIASTANLRRAISSDSSFFSSILRESTVCATLF